MLKEVAKTTIVLASSAVAIPYAVAFLANLLKGWPLGRDKYKRAFHPRKVYALNYAILLELRKLKYAWLYFKWRSYYANCTCARILKGLPYGNNENELDLYFPKRRNGKTEKSDPDERQLLPIVVFVYGGTWSSGDKNMYSLLCSRVADRLQAIVCCPNYSIYPRGYIDDMLQDIVDCLGWLHSNVHTYGGDKERIMLVGHSAGAHLCMMATLELTLKRLLHNPDAVVMPEGFVPEAPQLPALGESIRFHERYFDGSSNDEDGSETVTPPVMLSGTATPPVLALRSGPSTPPILKSAKPDSSINTGSFYMLDDSNNEREHSSLESDPEAFYLINKDTINREKSESGEEVAPKEQRAGDIEDKDVSAEKSYVNKEVKDETQVPKQSEQDEGETLAKQPVEVEAIPPTSAVTSANTQGAEELVIEDEDMMTPSQKDVRDLLNSIKHIIGLAGVYDIGDHYEHEAWRGVEDVSAMARAMYGLEHFERFSPTHVVSSLPPRTRLPPMTLVHGDLDKIVPVSSTSKYTQLCSQMSTRVNECHVRQCNHYDICLDLMDPNREFYEVIMGLIHNVAQVYL